MMADTTVNEINFKYEDNSGQQEKNYSIGTTFDKVIYGEETNGNTTKFYNYSLKNFFQTVKNFFNQPMHMIYRGSEPTDVNIVEWYQVEDVNNI